ncbi:MAG: hypothetical protein ACFE0Q_10415 [Anaerolineae bacterium]
MKQVFWSLLGAVVVWFFARSQMDELYGEVSRLREAERRRQEEAQADTPTTD